ncbi:putative ubiquitin-like-specific protease 2B-like [Hibiscus syriacus]|uniref:Ubiquitin-like-specific protease 2B-like n=1 Tax=Hibiscus syriacus TaxID=106335 RepID=A0A6A2XEW4_HIBSY|nr:putative ubiquitin-like-specific protease 2B-like [Hibiscus syriacus]
MFPLKSFCGVENDSPVTLMEGDDSINALSERKSMEACKSHKEAERRRRQRINATYPLFAHSSPNTTKTDKASLLAEVVHHSTGARHAVVVPEECDEAALSFCDEEGKLLKATVCCEDRPGLNHDLSRAIRSVQAKVMRAEMTVGGRTKCVVAMQWSGDEEQIGLLKRALKDVVENRVSSLAQETGFKRARNFGSDSETGHGFGELGFEGFDLGKSRRSELGRQQQKLGEERRELGIEGGLGIEMLLKRERLK